VIAVAAVAALSLLPVRGWAEGLQDWFEGLGAAGVWLFAGIYVVATLLLLPVWILTLIAGAVFGFVWGLAVVLAASLCGASAAFLIARHGLRDRVKKIFARHAMLRTVDKALRKAGWKVVALLRLSPLVPFTAQNYFFGVTHVSFAQYVLGTTLGLVPGTLVEVALGATGRAAMGGGPAQWTMLGMGVAATIVASWYIGKVARKRLGLH
jgi:uncharacterized membrane protein YdjX (TVP38/TMEM64 family)